MYVLFHYVYEGLCILVCIMFKLFISALYACSCSWGCLVLVASSSSVKRSGILQSGIRALVAVWACMGHERSDNRGRLSSAQVDEIDCKSVDMVSVSKIAELDHG